VRSPGIGILRIDVSLNFANVAFLKRRLRQLELDHPEGLHAIVLDGAGVNDIDASAESALSDLIADAEERSIEVHLASMKGPVRDVLDRSGLWSRLADRTHPSVHHAVLAIAARQVAVDSPSPLTPTPTLTPTPQPEIQS
jgi:sulfate permease, SulP family